MKMRTASMIGASFAYILLLLPLTRVGAQARPTASEPARASVGGGAAGLLSQIKLAVQGGEVSGSGPHSDSDDWTVYLLIRTPRAANSEVTAHNRPVSFYAVDGKITTRATNGPISLKDCS